VATDKFELTPRYKYKGMLWMGNIGLARQFLDSLDESLSTSLPPNVLVDNRGTLCVRGYKCTVLSDYVEVPLNSWLLLAYSEIDDGFRLMAVSYEAMEECFGVSQKEDYD
jgi:hypothetical protein